MAVTSGTITTGGFTQQQVIDHACRRAGYTPQQLSGEWIQVAQDLLFLQLAEYANAGFPLWTQGFLLLGATIGSPDVPTPNGTVEVLTTYWRSFQPYRGPATTTSGLDASILFYGAPNADVTIAGPSPGIAVSFSGPTEIDTVGVLLGGNTPVTAALQILTSADGVTYTVAQTLMSTTYQPMQWAYFDLNPSITQSFVSLVLPGATTWTLNQVLFGLANGTDTEIGPLNIDDYYNFPNKAYQADRANSAYVLRKIDPPTVKIWPTLNTDGFYAGTVAVLARRYIQDPGSMTNALEIPSRWIEAVISRLAIRLMDELPDPGANSQSGMYGMMAKNQRRQNLETAATKAESMAWSEERTRGPIRIVPDLSPYTK